MKKNLTAEIDVAVVIRWMFLALRSFVRPLMFDGHEVKFTHSHQCMKVGNGTSQSKFGSHPVKPAGWRNVYFWSAFPLDGVEWDRERKYSKQPHFLWDFSTVAIVTAVGIGRKRPSDAIATPIVGRKSNGTTRTGVLSSSQVEPALHRHGVQLLQDGAVPAPDARPQESARRRRLRLHHLPHRGHSALVAIFR